MSDEDKVFIFRDDRDGYITDIRTDPEIVRLTAERDEARRCRDEWRKKAEGYDAVRLALREKVGAPWPPEMSRLLWAGIAADEKKRADDAEAERDALAADLAEAREALEEVRPLIMGANHSAARYPLARAALGGPSHE